MRADSHYRLNPNIAWVNETSNQIYLIQPDRSDRICLEGIRAILWRCIGQGFSPKICATIAEGKGSSMDDVLNQWLESGLIVED